MTAMIRAGAALAALAALSAAVQGCAPLGARALPGDEPAYVEAIGESRKRQVFSNIVRLRYGEPVSFLTLTQIVQGYTFRASGGAELDFTLAPDSGPIAEGGLMFEDRPTMTFTPVQGRQLLDGYLRPLPPVNVFSAIQSGWPADLVFQLTVETVNGVSNTRSRIGRPKDAAPEFDRIADLFRYLRDHDHMDIAVRAPSEEDPALRLVIPDPRRDTPEIAALRRELRDLLGLDPDGESFALRFGRGRPKDGRTLNVETRSYLQMLSAIATTIEVPEEDVASGATTRTALDDPSAGRSNLRVRAGASDPGDVFVKTRYRGRWFWIDHDDFRSKRTLSFLLLLSALGDPTGDPRPPQLTISG